MAAVEVRDAGGNVLAERELPDGWFAAPVNIPLMHQVVTAGVAAQRAGTHAAKGRGDVSGGGRKPWRQKGTGRARQGSIRAPQWTGGGVVHGPKPRDHSVRVNKKMKRAALRSALSDTLASGKLALIDGLAFDEPRTKDAVALLAAFGLEGHVLIVLPAPDEPTEKCFRNLSNVKIDYPGNLSTYDLLFADRVLFTAAALDVLLGDATAEDATRAVEERRVARAASVDADGHADDAPEAEAARAAGEDERAADAVPAEDGEAE